MTRGWDITLISANFVFGAINVYFWNDPVNIMIGVMCTVTAALGLYFLVRA